jgi:hypothetical protein
MASGVIRETRPTDVAAIAKVGNACRKAGLSNNFSVKFEILYS